MESMVNTNNINSQNRLSLRKILYIAAVLSFQTINHFERPELLLSFLNGQQLPPQPQSNPFRRRDAQNNSVPDGETRDVIGQMVDMHLGTYGYYPNIPAHPYANQSTNPFLNPTNASQGYPSTHSNPYKVPSSSRRAQTPLPGSQSRHSNSSQYNSQGQPIGSSGSQLPHQRRQSHTMQQGNSIKRASTAVPRGSGP